MPAASAVNGARRAAAARRPPGCAAEPIAALRRLTRPLRARSRGEGGGGRGRGRDPAGGAEKPRGAAFGRGCWRRPQPGVRPSPSWAQAEPRARVCLEPGPGHPPAARQPPRNGQACPSPRSRREEPVSGITRVSGSERSQPALSHWLEIPAPSAAVTSAPHRASTPSGSSEGGEMQRHGGQARRGQPAQPPQYSREPESCLPRILLTEFTSLVPAVMLASFSRSALRSSCRWLRRGCAAPCPACDSRGKARAEGKRSTQLLHFFLLYES